MKHHCNACGATTAGTAFGFEGAPTLQGESIPVSHPRLGRGRLVPRQAESEQSERPGPIFHPRLGYGRSVPREADAGEWEPREVEIIPPTDDRVLITDTTAVPFRWICCLDLYYPDPDDPGKDMLFRGSGTLISPRHVLTCGHNLWDEVTGSRRTSAKREVRRITVTPGRNGIDAGGSPRRPFGSTVSSAVRYSTPWRTSQNSQFDFGLIILRDAIGSQPQAALGNRPLGFWGSRDLGAGTRIVSEEPSALQGKPANISGYPGDKCGTLPSVGSATQAQLNACPTNHWASNQWRAYGKVLSAAPAATPRLIRYDMDTFGGHSGSPVWLRLQDFRNLIAIHRAGSGIGAYNEGTRITQQVMREVQSWMS